MQSEIKSSWAPKAEEEKKDDMIDFDDLVDDPKDKPLFFSKPQVFEMTKITQPANKRSAEFLNAPGKEGKLSKRDSQRKRDAKAEPVKKDSQRMYISNYSMKKNNTEEDLHKLTLSSENKEANGKGEVNRKSTRGSKQGLWDNRNSAPLTLLGVDLHDRRRVASVVEHGPGGDLRKIGDIIKKFSPYNTKLKSDGIQSQTDKTGSDEKS